MTGPAANSSSKLFSCDRSDVLTLVWCVGLFFIWLNLLLIKFLYFGYYDWDLAMYAQATWALSHGSTHASLFGTNFLTNHAEYISFFLTPFYRLFPSAFTLVVFKILSFVSGSFIFYLIAKKLLGWRTGFLFMVLYQIHPANLFMMIYEFHFENLAILFIFLMYYFLLNRRFIPFLVSSFFATLIKENISLVVFMFSLLILFKRDPKEKIWTLGPLILGGGMFVLSVFLITPYLRHAEKLADANSYLYLYWNTSPQGASWIHNAWNLWDTFTAPLNRQYMWNLFSPFHIIPFFSPATLLLGAPIFLQHFLASSFTMHTMYYHYAATAIIFIFLATAQSLVKLKEYLRPLFYSFFIMITLTGYGLFVKGFLPEFEKRIERWTDRLDPVRQNFFDQIPKNASALASFDFLDRLANRKGLYSLHNVWLNHATFTGQSPFVLPPVSYALIDWHCPWLWKDLLNSERKLTFSYLSQIHNLYFTRPWQTVDAVEEITLLSTTVKSPQAPLVENSRSPFPGINSAKSGIEIGTTAKLIHFEIKTPAAGRENILPMVFIWQSQKPTDDFLSVELKLSKDKKIILQKGHPVGYAFNANPSWTEGQYIKEYYNLLIPTLAPGEYTLNVSIFNINKRTFEQLHIHDKTFDSFNTKVCIQCAPPNL